MVHLPHFPPGQTTADFESYQDRRQFLSTAAMGIAAGGVASLLSAGPAPAAESGAVRPFHIDIPKDALANLRERVTMARWPDRETVTDPSQGVQLRTIQQVAQHWRTDYDWRKVEARLKALPQFVTEIDGLDIHFIHIRSKHDNALPMIVTHGWPGSIIEQMKIIDPLANPTSQGASASDAFHLVIPSLPGHGFSGKPTAPGWTPVSIARAWATLMQRLGYTRYVAQGGDWGNAVSEIMALQQPTGLLGIHTNMAATVPADVSKALSAGGPPPAGLSADEKQAWDQLDDFYKHGLAYAQEMSNRPQTLYGIADSPIGLAAWMLDHDIRSYGMISRVFDGMPEGLTRDDILDNVTLYWLTNTAISSARLYWDTAKISTGGGFFDVRGVTIPVAVSAFPDEIYAAPRGWAERAYPNLIHYNKLDKGGHFAAWEQPELFCAEMRTAFRPLRQSI
ncbi:multidrug MFS transporter [Bradyrhizobium canariense]|uniref:Multidrug MFS transporter n=2 Tax=Nitrobacteraceae TaxID=41294 RepID=A0A1X3FD07_9BRAD|nr:MULTISPECIES: epoxide hydrolase [Bradyrhizobium]OSI64627.1 multidrug MFS transporter [Bradyrhizobium canariense]OSI79156.1 multidrug MFS transporter [Bradyrhizobium canariense]OSI90742.1 multidrug MFS transporter [Bradyrhizobium canariense]OSI91598.1 multidrug MFS transporter [Bradyrhizobium canariense]OSJ03664.1 multidrug MFS transporter [Bradyrhizobium canariense]